jgi:hypothetical protein
MMHMSESVFWHFTWTFMDYLGDFPVELLSDV